jgi:hypothetical protein
MMKALAPALSLIVSLGLRFCINGEMISKISGE